MDLNLSNHIDKNNLHHAYLIEGSSKDIIAGIYEVLENIGVELNNNPDLYSVSMDTFKIDDARNLNGLATLKAFSIGKKIFIISANNFLLEAQNSMLKLFEDPIEDTHFFIIVPSISGLLPTFVSRFYTIKDSNKVALEKNADTFISMALPERINFIKELLAEADEENKDIQTESTRSIALNFLNSLEPAAYQNASKNISLNTDYFDHFLKVREFLQQPGSSVKNLMESVALYVPNRVDLL